MHLADVELARTGSYLLQLFQHGMWIDRILYPAGVAVLLMSIAWLRQALEKPAVCRILDCFCGRGYLHPSPPG